MMLFYNGFNFLPGLSFVLIILFFNIQNSTSSYTTKLDVKYLFKIFISVLLICAIFINLYHHKKHIFTINGCLIFVEKGIKIPYIQIDAITEKRSKVIVHLKYPIKDFTQSYFQWLWNCIGLIGYKIEEKKLTVDAECFNLSSYELAAIIKKDLEKYGFKWQSKYFLE